MLLTFRLLEDPASYIVDAVGNGLSCTGQNCSNSDVGIASRSVSHQKRP